MKIHQVSRGNKLVKMIFVFLCLSPNSAGITMSSTLMPRPVKSSFLKTLSKTLGNSFGDIRLPVLLVNAIVLILCSFLVHGWPSLQLHRRISSTWIYRQSTRHICMNSIPCLNGIKGMLIVHIRYVMFLCLLYYLKEQLCLVLRSTLGQVETGCISLQLELHKQFAMLENVLDINDSADSR